MSIRQGLSQFADFTAFAGLGPGALAARRADRSRIAFLPVLHVEQLGVEAHFDGLIRYCDGYRRITGKRPVATVLTPLSPMLTQRLSETGASADLYAQRIARLGESAIIGLHGHFVRTGRGGAIRPMHESFFDASVIRAQIRAETNWLVERGLMDADRKIYSAGWWFMNDAIQGILEDEGYRHDYSIAAGRYCHSQAAWSERARRGSLGHVMRADESPGLIRATALCSASVPGRPRAAFRRLALDPALRRHRWQDGTYLTFYGHDYDLAADEGIEAVRLLHARGYAFFEPADLEARAV
ncbi:MAG: hypothetical protein OEN23_16885 [Paracoccaceae bacterium]|nr:hypothetical protein [Paracoccaceae bacterium]